MQIVIDVPDGSYEELNNGQFPVQDAYRLVAWIKDGATLPKDHGDLVDKNDVLISLMGFVHKKKTIGQCIDDLSILVKSNRKVEECR